MIAAITTASLSFLAGSGTPYFVQQQTQQPVVSMVAVRRALRRTCQRNIAIAPRLRSCTVGLILSACSMCVAEQATGFSTAKSSKIMAEARTIMPGGVSSPVRAFKSVGGEPVVFDRAKGSKAYDVDGNEYVDYVGSWGPAIVGHADDRVLAAIKETMDKGTSFGAPCALENELAKMVIDAVPSVEMVRFTNSGTEACMGVLRLMRAYTKREKIIKFDGCYHGHADAFLVAAGSGVATLGLPDSPGVTVGASQSTLVATYNDLESVKALFKANKGEIAGVILEGVVGNSGFIVPDKAFLTGLRQLCDENGALLVFDEVMTGFRISYGGAQKYFGVTPDLTTMGKVIGGGLPVGAYGTLPSSPSLVPSPSLVSSRPQRAHDHMLRMCVPNPCLDGAPCLWVYDFCPLIPLRVVLVLASWLY